jgi:DNA-binding Lrp family transcriptional regulator
MGAGAPDWRQVLDRAGIAVAEPADRFPMLGETELDSLAKDIDAEGMRCPLVLWREKEGDPWQLADGRNRCAAMGRLVEGDLRIEGAIGLADRRTGVDLGALVHSLNVERRHLSAEEKRARIADRLRADPTRSNRAIAAEIGLSKNTVANVRNDLEGRGQIDHVSRRVDTAGRQQPAHRQPPAAVVNNTTPRPAPMSKEQQLRALRENAAAATPPNPAATSLLAEIETFCANLKAARSDLQHIDRPTRFRLARGLVVALGIDPAEFGGSAA